MGAVAEYMTFYLSSLLPEEKRLKQDFYSIAFEPGIAVTYRNFYLLACGETNTSEMAKLHCKYTGENEESKTNWYDIVTNHNFGRVQIMSYHPAVQFSKKAVEMKITKRIDFNTRIIRDYHTPESLNALFDFS